MSHTQDAGSMICLFLYGVPVAWLGARSETCKLLFSLCIVVWAACMLCAGWWYWLQWHARRYTCDVCWWPISALEYERNEGHHCHCRWPKRKTPGGWIWQQGETAEATE
jgi:Na+/melibiose symporter-like transporter